MAPPTFSDSSANVKRYEFEIIFANECDALTSAKTSAAV